MFNNINKQPLTDNKANQPDFQKGISQNNAEELRAEFAPRSAVVKVLPDPKSVRDFTQVILDKGEGADRYRALYMMIDGKWELMNIISPTWDDLRFPSTLGNLSGANSATWVTYKTNFSILRFADSVTPDSVIFYAQMPHTYLEGSDIEPHVHMTLPVAGGGGTKNIQWNLTYSWVNINESPFTTGTVISSTINYGDAIADKHLIHALPTISGRGKKISSMIILRLSRPQPANRYTNNVYLLEFDIHYQSVQWGSIQEFKQVIQG